MRASVKTALDLATKFMENHSRALKIGGKFSTAAVSKNPKAALNTIADEIFSSFRKRIKIWKSHMDVIKYIQFY